MSSDEKSTCRVRFSLVDLEGNWIKQGGVSGLLGFAAKQDTECGPDHPLIHAIHATKRGESFAADESCEVRSFMFVWLLVPDAGEGLADVIMLSTDVPESIHALERVGVIGRTLKKTAMTGVKLAGAILLVNSIWETAGAFAVDMAAATNPDLGDILVAELKAEVADGILELPEAIERELDKQFGAPGEKRPVSTLDVESIIAFTRFAQMLKVADGLEASPGLKATLVHRMEQRVFSAFLIVSRQCEGVALNGVSATPAVVSAHAALALGLSELEERHEVLSLLNKAVDQLPKGVRRDEAERTLAALVENVTEETTNLARSLSRNSAAAATTELADLSLMPVGMTCKFVGSVAGGLGKLMEGTVLAPALNGVKAGLKGVASASDATPDAIARVFQAGIYTEAAVRGGAKAVTKYVSGSISSAMNLFREKAAKDDESEE